MTTIYLAGPMRGYEDFNFPAFDAAAKALRAGGWTVLSPAERDREHGFDETRNTLDGFDLEAAMTHDLGWIVNDADGIVLLPGWEESTGAKIERLVAETCGKQVWLYHENESGTWVVEDTHRKMTVIPS
jgi:hypothetical protein